MNQKILLDIGSSTIKVYKFSEKKLTHLQNHTIFFKEDFTPKKGINQINKKLLIDFLQQLKTNNPNTPIEIFATSIFRKMHPQTQIQFKSNILEKTNLNFQILSHNQESFFMQQALIKKIQTKPVLIINIGGGSTELIFTKGKENLETHQLENLGVGTIMTKYPKINESSPQIKLTELVSEIKSLLPNSTQKINTAFYSGGELTFMKLAKYPLSKNTLFDDPSHPFIISLSDFQTKNQTLFSDLTLSDLESMMPKNPKWMHGSRSCSAIAQAICEKFSIQNIIPSDANLIDGIINSES